jgi:histone H3/H4
MASPPSAHADMLFHYVAANIGSYTSLFASGMPMKPITRIVKDLSAKRISATESEVVDAMHRVVQSGVLESDCIAPRCVHVPV